MAVPATVQRLEEGLPWLPERAVDESAPGRQEARSSRTRKV